MSAVLSDCLLRKQYSKSIFDSVKSLWYVGLKLTNDGEDNILKTLLLERLSNMIVEALST